MFLEQSLVQPCLNFRTSRELSGEQNCFNDYLSGCGDYLLNPQARSLAQASPSQLAELFGSIYVEQATR
jgi:hypothetical protein